MQTAVSPDSVLPVAGQPVCHVTGRKNSLVVVIQGILSQTVTTRLSGKTYFFLLWPLRPEHKILTEINMLCPGRSKRELLSSRFLISSHLHLPFLWTLDFSLSEYITLFIDFNALKKYVSKQEHSCILNKLHLETM